MQVLVILLTRLFTPTTMQNVSKKCKECGEVKLLAEFPLFSTTGAGRKNTCKCCSNKQATVRRRLKRQHPIPSDGECPSCGRYTTQWVLDHDHKTDRFRGYICNACNVAFGKFDDDPSTMQRSLIWLQSHG